MRWVFRLLSHAMLPAALAFANPAMANDGWREIQQIFFKGHRIATYLNDATRRAAMRIDDQQVLEKDDSADLGKIGINDLGATAIFVVQTKSIAGCRTQNLIALPLAADADKIQVVSDFGACNAKAIIQTSRRSNWATWYIFAYRDDLPTVQVATLHENQFVTKDVTAPPCLFVQPQTTDCAFPMAAELDGSVARGLWQGSATAAGHKIVTYFNRLTGLATIELDGQPYRTIDNVAQFYVNPAPAESPVALFDFWIKLKDQECATRPLLFLPAPKDQPQFTQDFAPCSERLIRVASKKKNAAAIILLALRPNQTNAYLAVASEHKMVARQIMLPACMAKGEANQSSSCLAGALRDKTPQIHSVPIRPPQPAPLPSASKPPPLHI